MESKKRELSSEEERELLRVLKSRFESNMNRHKDLDWLKIEEKLLANRGKLWDLNEMEKSGGEPDVVAYDKDRDEYIFFDCCPESPKGRRSLCYDNEALQSRKQNKPVGSAVGMATEMGIELLTEEQYGQLQKLGQFDMKTSSWLKTPAEIRKLGGAIFGDLRYGRVFVYHNGAESYYGARGFRGCVRV